MKKFLLKIVYFFLPLVILSYPCDYGISYFLSESNQSPGEFEVWNDIYNSNANFDIAIYGSSRAWVHIDPKIISDSLNFTAYNFGIDGHNFRLQYLRHLELIKYNKKPKTIILGVDIFSLQKTTGLYNSDQFLPYMLWNSNIMDFTYSYIAYDEIDFYLPLVRYAGRSEALTTSIKMVIKGAPDNHYRNNGFLGMDKVWNTDFEEAKAIHTSYKIDIHQDSIELLETFINECRIMGIELILVYTPEYIEGQSFVSNRDEVIDIFENFSKQYNLAFYDYSNDSISWDKSLFYNVSHLNKTGAEIFTRKFASDLKARTYNN